MKNKLFLMLTIISISNAADRVGPNGTPRLPSPTPSPTPSLTPTEPDTQPDSRLNSQDSGYNSRATQESNNNDDNQGDNPPQLVRQNAQLIVDGKNTYNNDNK